MKKYIKPLRIAAVCLTFMLAAPSVVSAANFNDVSSTYWAYDAINSITSQGLMVGDLSGNFNPDNFIDKFDTAKILSKVLGYNYNSASNQDKAYYDKIYSERKSFIDQYAKAFKRWNPAADKEIAFLLEKGVLKNEDLNQFVIKNTDGKEQIRALSREEFAVFLVRIMGKSNEAAQYKITEKFSDDSLINSAKRQSIYYLKSLGIVSGNTDGKFRPNGAVTRADFCVLLNNTLKHMGKTVSADSTLNTDMSSSSNVVVNNIETVSGSLDKYFPSLNVIQINIGSTQKLYKVTSSAEIKIDGFNGSLSDLKEGMNITALLNNSEVVQLSAESAGSSVIPNTENFSDGDQSDQDNQNNQIPNDQVNQSEQSNQGVQNDSSVITASISDDDLTMIVGSVEAVNGNNITFSYRMVNSRDEVNTQSKTYTLADNAKITRNSVSVSVDEISVDDIATAKILGSKIYSLELEGGSLILNDAVLVKKYYNKSKSMPALIVEEDDGKSYELFVTDDSEISRNIEDETDWNDLRIGDKVSLKTNLNKIESLSASGEKRSLEGFVTEVRISSDGSYIGLSEDENDDSSKLYTVDENTIDLYSVKVGDKVKMYLESDEAVTVNVKKSSSQKNATGYISSVKSSYIYIETTENGEREKVEYDDDTVFLSSISGKKIKSSELDDDMKVYVVFEDSSSKLAKTITVLNNGEN